MSFAVETIADEITKIRELLANLGHAPTLETRFWAVYVEEIEKPDWADDDLAPSQWCQLSACDELLWCNDEEGFPYLCDVTADTDVCGLFRTTNFVGLVPKRKAETDTEATNLARLDLSREIDATVKNLRIQRDASPENPST